MRAMIAALVVMVGVALPLSGCSDSNPEIPEIEGYTLQTNTSYLIHERGSNDVYVARVTDDGAAYKWLILNEHVFELNGFAWDHVSFNLDAPTMDHFTTSPFVRDEDSGTVYSLHSEPNTDHGTKLVVALTTSELEECGVDLDSILLVNPEGLSLYYTTSDIGIWNCGDLP